MTVPGSGGGHLSDPPAQTSGEGQTSSERPSGETVVDEATPASGPEPAMDAGPNPMTLTGGSVRGHHGTVVPTRASSSWTAAVGAVVLLLLLAVFVGQNSRSSEITFLAWHGRAPMAVLLLVAAVVSGALVAAAGVARILQLRRRRTTSEPPVD